jgi:hypothetical protein
MRDGPVACARPSSFNLYFTDIDILQQHYYNYWVALAGKSTQLFTARGNAMSEKLKAAFLDKEKADLYLFNLGKLKEENGIEEMYYQVLKTEYTKLKDEAIVRIDSIKADIKKVLDAKLKEAAVAKLNYKYLEIRYKVGQIPASAFLKQEQGPKKKIAELEKDINNLQSLVNASNSAEVGAPTKKKEGFKIPVLGRQPTVKPDGKNEEKPADQPVARPRPIPIPLAGEHQAHEWTPLEQNTAAPTSLLSPAAEQHAEAEPEAAAEAQLNPELEMAPEPEPEIPKKTTPPGLSITDLDILPDRVVHGNHIGVIARIKNVGHEFFSHLIEMKINGDVFDTAEIHLEPGQTQELTFMVAAGAPGEYSVDIEGRESTYTVVPSPH